MATIGKAPSVPCLSSGKLLPSEDSNSQPSAWFLWNLVAYDYGIWATMPSKECKKSSESNPGWILLPEQMDILKKKPYFYNATAGSLLELLFLQRFWTSLVKCVPQRVAPCSLTCLGLLINLLCCLTLLYHCSNTESDAPAWTFVLCAVGVFLYQTLDALDGKQAIRVQNTQLEEVYDHGCDAVSTVFVSLATCSACHLGKYPLLLFLVIICSLITFYTTHWQDHITHVMIFGKVDVSEAQFVVIAIHLVTACFGQHVWQLDVVYGVQLYHIMAVLTLLNIAISTYINMGYILGNKTPLDDFTSIPRKQGAHTWNPMVPLLILTALAAKAFSSRLFELGPCVFLVAFGLSYAKITVKLVIANVTQADMDLWDWSLLAPLLLCLNIHFRALPEYTALLCFLVYDLMDLARYFTYVSWDMRECLDVWIFSLKYRPGDPKCRNGNLGVYVNGLNNNEVKASARKAKGGQRTAM